MYPWWLSLSSYNAEEIAKKQHNEPVFRCLITFLESGDMPSESDLILMGPEAKCYFLERGQFKVDSKGVTWREESSGSDRLLVPGDFREEVLALVYDIPSSGYQGVQRTKLWARENFHWWRMGDSVRNYVITCDTCSRNKRGPLPSKARLKSYQAGSPWRKST